MIPKKRIRWKPRYEEAVKQNRKDRIIFWALGFVAGLPLGILGYATWG